MKDFVLDIREALSRPEDAIAFQLCGKADLPPDCGVEGDAILAGTCQNIGKNLILVTGTLRYHAVGQCARCLEPAGVAMEAPFEERFSRAPDDEEIFLYTGDAIDLGEAVRQSLILSYPDRILCKEDCKGICPICGQVLNVRDCGCTAKGSDLEED
jgi:uncharacterized protein